MVEPRLLLVALGLTVSLGAAEADGREAVPPAAVTVELGDRDLEVGDVAKLRIVYRWPANTAVIRAPDPAGDLHGLLVEELIRVDQGRVGDDQREVWRAQLVVPVSGTWSLPRPWFSIRGPDGPERIVAEERLLPIGIGEEEPALEPARPLWQRAEAGIDADRWSAWQIGALVGGIAGGLAALAWVLWRRRGKMELETPLETFERELGRARQAALGSDEGKQAGALLSLALRRYAGRLYDFDGPGATVEEALAHLRQALPTQLAQGLRSLLRQLDDLRWQANELSAVAVVPFIDQAQQWVAQVEAHRAAEAEAAATAEAAS